MPIGLALLAVSARLLLVQKSELRRPLDPAGWVMLAGSAIALAAFTAVQHRVADRGSTPLIHHRVVIVPSTAAIFPVMATVGGFLLALTLHLQAGLGDRGAARRAHLLAAGARVRLLRAGWH